MILRARNLVFCTNPLDYETLVPKNLTKKIRCVASNRASQEFIPTLAWAFSLQACTTRIRHKLTCQSLAKLSSFGCWPTLLVMRRKTLKDSMHHSSQPNLQTLLVWIVSVRTRPNYKSLALFNHNTILQNLKLVDYSDECFGQQDYPYAHMSYPAATCNALSHVPVLVLSDWMKWWRSPLLDICKKMASRDAHDPWYDDVPTPPTQQDNVSFCPSRHLNAVVCYWKQSTIRSRNIHRSSPKCFKAFKDPHTWDLHFEIMIWTPHTAVFLWKPAVIILFTRLTSWFQQNDADEWVMNLLISKGPTHWSPKVQKGAKWRCTWSFYTSVLDWLP